MKTSQDQLYYKGYIEGYRDGLKAAVTAELAGEPDPDTLSLPIKAMALSTRAYNCLSRAGCVYVADVVQLNAYSIFIMRNMGVKTASEVARWLDTHSIRFSAWSGYL